MRRVLYLFFFASAMALLVGFAFVAVPYFKYARDVDRQLANGPYQHSMTYYSAPEEYSTGDPASALDMESALRRAGYRRSPAGEPNTFDITQAGIAIQLPGTRVLVRFNKGAVTSITDAAMHTRVDRLMVPAQVLTNVSDQTQAQRKLLHYSDLPAVLIRAVTAAEDKRFFEHSGLDALRLVKASYVDLREGRKEQGASTITMQLARNLYLDRDKRWRRKLAEMLIATHLERELTKQQILEIYANEVYMGRRGPFSIHGFGEAARVYFNKDVRALTLPEAALLAGLIQRPSYFNPFRYPQRAVDRRNIVLKMMRDDGYIDRAQYAAAVATQLQLSPGSVVLSQSQYFIDIASDRVQKDVEDADNSGVLNVYTTLDLRLQRAAERAIADGMAKVDKVTARHRGKGQARAQAALIALDPRTGEVLALCGGRNYSASQLDRVLMKRPPGSVFKPFVYAAALNTAIAGGAQVFTEASTVLDQPTTFQFADQTYSPANFRGEYMGRVTLRKALAHSLNAATVRLAQTVGYDNIAALAHRFLLNDGIQATPAVALGAYDVTPYEIARAYTAFPGYGELVQPRFIGSVQRADGERLYNSQPDSRPVIDARVAFLMDDRMSEVLRSGTAASVRGHGFKLPAAGKTGTSHDGWFVGFTSRLLCVVWVGYDDYRQLGLEGSRSALPIWTEFMKEAAQYAEYADAQPFKPPPGVVRTAVDMSTGDVAGPYCTGAIVSAYFISGTQPQQECQPLLPVDQTADRMMIMPFATAETEEMPRATIALPQGASMAPARMPAMPRLTPAMPRSTPPAQ